MMRVVAIFATTLSLIRKRRVRNACPEGLKGGAIEGLRAAEAAARSKSSLVSLEQVQVLCRRAGGCSATVLGVPIRACQNCNRVELLFRKGAVD